MSNKIAIKNVKTVFPDGVKENLTVLCEDGVITDILPCGQIDGYTVIDGEGNYLSPGFIDAHLHGGGGSDFMDEEDDAYNNIIGAHLVHGTTSFMPTTLASDTDSLINAVKRYEKIKTEGDVGDYLVGLHLEGPYLSPYSAGAQKPEHIRDYDKNEYEKVIEIANGNVGRWSGAPEVKGAGEFAKYMAKHGVTVSIAHTDATFEQTLKAFEDGFKHITHFYSCTSSVKREKGFRIAGVIEAGYFLDDMNVEIIADGCHLPQSLLKLIVKVKGTDRVMLVTDAMRAAGQDVKESYLGAKTDPMPVVIEDGVAKLLSREAFGGSIATADRLVRTMLGVGVSVSDAVKMITVNPVKMMNIKEKIGKIEKGYIADLCIFDENVNVKKVIKRGKIVFSEEK